VFEQTVPVEIPASRDPTVASAKCQEDVSGERGVFAIFEDQHPLLDAVLYLVLRMSDASDAGAMLTLSEAAAYLRDAESQVQRLRRCEYCQDGKSKASGALSRQDCRIGYVRRPQDPVRRRFWLLSASGAMIPTSSRSCEMLIGDAAAQVSS
jgi:hypothetical protein